MAGRTGVNRPDWGDLPVKWDELQSMEAVAAHYGVTAGAVYKALRRQGITQKEQGLWSLDVFVDQVRAVCLVDGDGCWKWNYGSMRDHTCHGDDCRYPQVMIGGERIQVSRTILEIATGHEGEVARHTCDVHCCCNPGHLLWGSQADNIADSIERGRHIACLHLPVGGDQSGVNHWTHRFPERVKRGEDNLLTGRTRPDLSGERNGSHTHPEKRPVGEQHGRSKLLAEQVREIRMQHADGVSVYRLALTYEVTKMTIKMIVERRTWRHV